jgi:hypothetical protein
MDYVRELCMDELDEILLEQLHNPYIEKGEVYIDNRIKFFESMIQDKSLLFKKPKKKKTKQSDLLSRNPAYEWYRNAMFITNFGYKIFTDSISQYMSYFKKGKE